VFTSWGVETARKFTREEIENALKKLDSREFGFVLRAKGIVADQNGGWLHFDYVPGEYNVRSGSAEITGKLCVIGAELDQQDIAELFGV
jgi:G3E family GTPase